MIKNCTLIFSIFIFLPSCLTSKLLNEEKKYEETIVGVLSLNDSNDLVVIGQVKSYAVTQNGHKILKAFQAYPDLGINLKRSEITLNDQGLFIGSISLVTLRALSSKEDERKLQDLGFKGSRGKYWEIMIPVSGNTVEIINKDKVKALSVTDDKKIEITVSPTAFDRTIKVIKAPVYIAGDAGLAAGAAAIGTAGMAIMIPIVIVGTALGADF